MRIIAPNWITHGEVVPIFSVHIHPNGDKLATAGQAEKSARGMLAIWNFEPIRQQDKFEDSNCPKLLAKLPHDAGLNCVRWSPDGRLAVCSDDKTTIVYEYCGRVNTAGTIGSKEANIERYKRTHTLRGHNLEVLQVEWSPDGRFLASCSLDGSIIVWKAAHLSEQVVVLNAARDGHTAGIKGISWDPIGRYLTSQGEDKALRIWLIDEWKCEGVLKKPFDDVAQTTMFARGQWTPDGQFYLAPGAMNNGGPTVEIVSRGQWDKHVNDLVGHRKATTVVSVCPQMVSFETKSGKTITASIVVVGGREGNLSIWLVPQAVRPLCIFEHVFNNTISDMSWDGFDLTISSLCGRLVLLQFDDGEFGKALSIEDLGHICEKLYQRVPVQYRDGGQVVQRQMSSYSGSQSLNNDLDLSFTDFDSHDGLLNGNSSQSDGRTNGVHCSPVATNGVSAAKKKQIAELLEQRKEQKETRTETGKRRIQPVFIASSISEHEPVLLPKKPRIVPTAISTTSSAKTANSIETGNKNTVIQSVVQSQMTDRIGGAASCAGCSKQPPGLTEEEKKKALETRRGKMMATALEKPEARAFELTKIKVAENSKEFEPVTQEASLQISINNETTLHINNEAPIATASLKVHGKFIWQLSFASGILLATSSRSWIALGCSDCTVTIVTLEGSEWLTVTLDSQPVRLSLDDKFLIALAQNGQIRSWDIPYRTSVLSNACLLACPLLPQQFPPISLFRSSPAGTPLIVFQSGQVIAYSIQVASWLKLDVSPCLSRLFKGFPVEQLAKDGPISSMLKHSLRSTTRGKMLPSQSQAEASVAERQFEQWISACAQLKSPQDFRAFSNCYIELLIHNKNNLKLDRFLSDLPTIASACGLDSAELRRAIDAAHPQLAELTQRFSFF